MFGFGFTEILIIAVIAILFLGPDKLPSAMVDIAKFFRTVKQSIGSMKDSLEEEINVADIKNEVLSYKKELLDATDTIKKSTNIADVGAELTSLNDNMDNILEDDTPIVKKKKTKKQEPQEVTFKKKSKLEDTDV